MSEASFITAALKAFKQNLDRTTKVFSTLTEDQLQTRIAPNKNRLIYLWGHLIAVQDAMLPLLDIGKRLYPDYEAIFLTSPDGASSVVPTAAKLNQAWAAINGKLLPALDAFAPAQWLERHTLVSAEDFAKEPHRNRYAILLSRTSHLAYHLGQAALAK